MSIPHGLLALLDQRPMYGYQLRAEFERATGATWPLNIGQVYTTLTRLERDGQVVGQATDEEGRQRYEITAVGRETLRTWFTDPVTLGDRPRDELAIKLALAALSPGLDVQAVVQNQRVATMQRLQELTRLKRDAPTPSAEDLAKIEQEKYAPHALSPLLCAFICSVQKALHTPVGSVAGLSPADSSSERV